MHDSKFRLLTLILSILVLPVTVNAQMPRAQSKSIQAQAVQPIPPDAEAITVYGRYTSSLESLAPPGVDIGDLEMADGKLIVAGYTESRAALKRFMRALERSPWYAKPALSTAADINAQRGDFVLWVEVIQR